MPRRLTTASAFSPTSNRDVICRVESDAFQKILDGLDGKDVMDMLDDTIDQRMHLVSFMEKQLDVWFDHPAITQSKESTWSMPFYDLG